MIIALLVAMSTTVAAQSMPLPRTGPWTDANGEVIGTVTIDGLRMYLRTTEGKLVVTIVIGADGTKTMYDPDGKILDQQK